MMGGKGESPVAPYSFPPARGARETVARNPYWPTADSAHVNSVFVGALPAVEACPHEFVRVLPNVRPADECLQVAFRTGVERRHLSVGQFARLNGSMSVPSFHA